MARSDLLVSLVKASSTGNRQEVERTVEAIVAEERKKSHYVLADRLQRAMKANGQGVFHALPTGQPDGREAILEIVPRRALEELVLPDAVLSSCRKLIE